ncbi:MAG: Rqc2 family fibronectin-binding protein [Anaerovoracaceae bacterium]
MKGNILGYDGLFIKALSEELNSKIFGARIEKIYQPERNTIVIVFRAKREKHKLCISCAPAGTAAYLIEDLPENPITPPGFCMLLRKYLLGSKLDTIKQIGTDRILEFSFSYSNEFGENSKISLVAELFGKNGNLILINRNTNIILDALKRSSIDSSENRAIFPGILYELPINKGQRPFNELSSDYLNACIDANNEKGLANLLVKSIQGFSPLIAKEIIITLEDKITNSDKPINLAHILLEVITEKIKQIGSDFNVYTDTQRVIDFHCLAISSLENYELIHFNSPSRSINYFFSNSRNSNIFIQEKTVLLQSIERQLKKLSTKKIKLLSDLKVAENSTHYQLYGELLTANMHLLKPGMKSATLINYYTNSEIIIPLDEKISPAKNAQKYFKKYAKAKTAVREKNAQLEKCQEEIEYLEEIKSNIEMAEKAEELAAINYELSVSSLAKYFPKYRNINNSKMNSRKMAAHSKSMKNKSISNQNPLKFTLADGAVLYVGRNNIENEYITFKASKKGDIWLHAKDVHGAHGVLRNSSENIQDELIIKAAEILAYYSKARYSENVPVDYVPIKNVKKIPGSLPGKVYFRNNQTIFVNPKNPKEQL